MPDLHLLGTGAALSEPHRTTTMLALQDEGSLFLIDCGGDVVQRVFAAGLSLDDFTGMLITHEHADHTAGFPLFMEKIWLAGRRHTVPVYGPPEAISQARRCFETFDVSTWPEFPGIAWHEGIGPTIDDASWSITTALVNHSVPTVGARIESKRTHGVVAYSADTMPCDAVVQLAENADILVHEATGAGFPHSSAIEAADMARRARAKRLILVHLPMVLDPAVLKEAQVIFPNTEWGNELGAYPF